MDFLQINKTTVDKVPLVQTKILTNFRVIPKIVFVFLLIGKLSRLSLNMIVPIRNALPDQTIILMQGGAVLVLDLIVKNLTSAY